MGIFIGKFINDVGQTEFRVTQVGNDVIDNCDEDHRYPDQLTDAYLILCFGGRYCYDNLEDAISGAFELVRRGWDGRKSSRVTIIDYKRSMPKMTREQAKDFVRNYWNNIPLSEEAQC